MSGRSRIPRPSDLLKLPLLHLDDSKSWSQWFETAGIADAELSHGLVLNRASMLIDAAVDGQGVALARTTLAAWDLLNGRLVRPFDLALRLSRTYWIVCPKTSSRKPKITTFRDWLQAEAADDVRRLKKIACFQILSIESRQRVWKTFLARYVNNMRTPDVASHHRRRARAH